MKNFVKRERILRNLTQEKLSRASGVARSTIAAIEKGGRTPGVDVALLLAKALQRRVEELFST